MSSQETETVDDLKQQLEERDVLIRELAEALREVKGRLDYLVNLWGNEGVTNRVIQGIDAVLAKVPESGTVQEGGKSSETTWQPIETAPKGGTEVIVLCGRRTISLGWYFAPSSITFGWRNQNGVEIKPTHWMPLPPPPTN